MPLSNYTAFESRRTQIGWPSDFPQRLSYCNDGITFFKTAWYNWSRVYSPKIRLLNRRVYLWMGVDVSVFPSCRPCVRGQRLVAQSNLHRSLGCAIVPSNPRRQPIRASSGFFWSWIMPSSYQIPGALGVGVSRGLPREALVWHSSHRCTNPQNNHYSQTRWSVSVANKLTNSLMEKWFRLLVQ